MPMFSSYLCAALGRECPLVPIHGINDQDVHHGTSDPLATDHMFQHGSNSFGEQPDLECAWTQVKQRNTRGKFHHDSDQVFYGDAFPPLPRRVPVPMVTRPKSTRRKGAKIYKARTSSVTLHEANDVLDMIIRKAVVDGINTLTRAGFLQQSGHSDQGRKR